MKTVTIYTDGACSGNPGPGGWGADFDVRPPPGSSPAGSQPPPTTAWS
ncbi:MAG: RNase H family protein [Dysosmobacter sp.]